MTEVGCSINSNWSVIITYIYTAAMLLTLITVTIKFVLDLDETQKGCFKKFVSWLKSLWQKKKLYLVVIAHIFDTATDIAVVIYYYELYIEKKKRISSGDTLFCDSVDPFFLFIASIFILIEYRIVSSVTIYIAIKNITLSLLQLFDFSLFKAVYVNYKLHRDKANTAQSWISGMEAMFESAPQSLIQIGFIWKVSHHGNATIPVTIIISLLMTLYSIASKMMENDKKLFTNINYKTHEHNCAAFIKCKGSLHWRFFVKLLWRLIDLSHNLLMYLIVWIALSIVSFGIYIGVYIMALLIVVFVTKEPDYLQFLMGWSTVIDGTDENNKIMVKSLYNALWIFSIIYKMIWFGIVLFMKIKDKTDSDGYFDMYTFGFWVLVFNGSYLIISYPITFILYQKWHILRMEGQSSTNRAFYQIIESEDWDGLREMLLFDAKMNYEKDSEYLNKNEKYKQIFSSLNPHGRSAFHLVCFSCHSTLDDVKFVYELPGSKEYINVKDTRSECTPLMFACKLLFPMESGSISDKEGHTDIIKFCVDHGAKVNFKDKWGNAPIHICAQYADVAAIECLLESGVDIHMKGENDKTALELCAQRPDDDPNKNAIMNRLENAVNNI